jgi:hypothetical protein
MIKPEQNARRRAAPLDAMIRRAGEFGELTI